MSSSRAVDRAPRRRLILASGSPRRRDLLAGVGLQFDVVSPRVAELASRELTARELTLGNALRKAAAVDAQYPDAVVLAADTLVALDREPIGKPADLREAREILRRLSGRTHEVWTAVVISCAAMEQQCAFEEISRVTFRKLDDAAITAYFATVNPLDKAGAYAAQEEGAAIIARVAGSFTNVIALPMEKTIAALRDFGIVPRRA